MTLAPVRRAQMFAAIAIAAIAATLLPGAAGQAERVSVVVRSTDAGAARAAVEASGGEVTRDLSIVDGVAAALPPEAMARLMRDRTLAVTRDLPVNVMSEEPVRDATAVYPRAIGATDLWAKGARGQGVTIALVDTGVAKVGDLGGRVIGGVDLTHEGDPYLDSFGHGTFVAGVTAGSGAASKGAYTGVAPAAKLVSIKIAGRSGASDVSHVLAAIQWAVSFKDAYGIRVLNLPLGTDSTQPYQFSPLNYAVERAWDSGIVVIVSASNSGPDARTVTKPGDDPLVITVGALDDAGSHQRNDDGVAFFSGRGPTASNGIAKPDLVAPGRSVIGLRAPGSAVDTAYPGSRIGNAYFKGSGTSFSAGITSGAVALMLSREPALTPNQVKARLLGYAAPGPVGDANVDGYGSLDAAASSYAGTYGSANQGVKRSTGTGTIDADRGSLSVGILKPKSILGWIVGLVFELLTGEKTAQDKLFDAVEYTKTDWNGSRWYDSQWSGSRWYETDWNGSRWYGSRWYGSRWYAVAWE